MSTEARLDRLGLSNLPPDKVLAEVRRRLTESQSPGLDGTLERADLVLLLKVLEAAPPKK